jgi:hypothetical protein
MTIPQPSGAANPRRTFNLDCDGHGTWGIFVVGPYDTDYNDPANIAGLGMRDAASHRCKNREVGKRNKVTYLRKKPTMIVSIFPSASQSH